MHALISLPSRGRPREFRRFVHSYAATGGTIRVRVRLDNDDPALVGYTETALPANWCLRIGRRKSCMELQEEAWRENPGLDVFALVSDDVVPETPGWDAELCRDAAKGFIAFPEDGFEGPNLATHPFLPGELVRANGGPNFPGLKHLYADTAWTQIGAALGILRYRPDIVLRHRKWINEGRKPTGTSIRPEGQDEADRAVFESMDINAIANRLRVLMPGMAA